MPTKSRGFTLIEVIVVAALFFMIVTMVCQTLIYVMPAQRSLAVKTQKLREAATAVARLQREMRTTAQVHWPAGNWTTYTPDLQATNGPLMFVKNAAPLGWRSGNIIAYWHHPVNKTISRVAYDGTGFIFGNDATYNPLNNETVDGRVLARGIESFTLRKLTNGQAEYVAIEIEVEGVKDILTSQIRLLPSPGL